MANRAISSLGMYEMQTIQINTAARMSLNKSGNSLQCETDEKGKGDVECVQYLLGMMSISSYFAGYSRNFVLFLRQNELDSLHICHYFRHICEIIIRFLFFLNKLLSFVCF